MMMTAILAFMDCAHAQTAADTPKSREPAPYCAALQEIATLAMSKDRFSSIIGKPREGGFYDTSLPLPAWRDCAFYGPATYTCDTHEFTSDEEAARAESETAQRILACLQYWDVADEQSSISTNFIVLHPRIGPASITLNLDKAVSGKFYRPPDPFPEAT